MTARHRDPLAARIASAGWDWPAPDWPPPPGVGAFATTRGGGVSAAPRDSLNLALHCGDDPAAVAENRRRVGALLPSPPVWLEQVHGREVVVLDAGNVDAARTTPPRADAAVTRTPGVVCAVLTADCLPVLFADREGAAVGAAHAGWRGLAGGVLEATVAAFADLGVPATRLAAWLGPAIGPGAFVVGPDVVDAFCALDPARPAPSPPATATAGSPTSMPSPAAGSPPRAWSLWRAARSAPGPIATATSPTGAIAPRAGKAPSSGASRTAAATAYNRRATGLHSRPARTSPQPSRRPVP